LAAAVLRDVAFDVGLAVDNGHEGAPLLPVAREHEEETLTELSRDADVSLN
jgi:hypothetical protein